LSFCRRFLLAGAGCVHDIGGIPLQAILLKGAEAIATLGFQWGATLKLWINERANLGSSSAGVQCHRYAGRRSGTFLLDDLGYLGRRWFGLRRRCRRGLCGRWRWSLGRSTGLG
jgi:hypothetical protein